METDNQHPMENYFEFLSPDDIRIKGTRVGIETVLDDYLGGASPEEIAARYRTLTLEQVYATITYYLHDRSKSPFDRHRMISRSMRMIRFNLHRLGYTIHRVVELTALGNMLHYSCRLIPHYLPRREV